LTRSREVGLYGAIHAGVVIALIALAGSIFSALATVFGRPVLQARREARAVLARHREPLLAAAYELQSRLHNILCNRFVEDYVLEARARKPDAALESTLLWLDSDLLQSALSATGGEASLRVNGAVDLRVDSSASAPLLNGV
jgi:hypothetical protein